MEAPEAAKSFHGVLARAMKGRCNHPTASWLDEDAPGRTRLTGLVGAGKKPESSSRWRWMGTWQKQEESGGGATCECRWRWANMAQKRHKGRAWPHARLVYNFLPSFILF